MKIKTNNVPRDVIDAWELTEAERAEFDYLDWEAIERGEDGASFVRFKGELYDLAEFERVTPERYPAHYGLGAWDGIRSDSFFSGLVIRWARDENGDEDPERVVVGLYLT